jgi:hypothetical protein
VRVRRGPSHPLAVVPGYPEAGDHGPPWTLEHVLLVCRRYLQDLACFDFEVPKLCIDCVDLIYDGRFQWAQGSTVLLSSTSSTDAAGG